LWGSLKVNLKFEIGRFGLIVRVGSCRLLILPLFRGSSRFESLILSHHSRFNVTCECNKVELNDDGLVAGGAEPAVVREHASLLLLRLELSDTKVYETQIRALLGTASHFCEVVVLKLRTVGGRSVFREHARPNSHGVRPDHLIIMMIKWIRTIKNSLSGCRLRRTGSGSGTRASSGRRSSRSSATRSRTRCEDSPWQIKTLDNCWAESQSGTV